MPKKILLQSTIPATENDWSIARFSRLGALLREQRDGDGNPLYDVTMRDRDPPGRPDSVLSTIDQSDFDQLWLIAVDNGDGLTEEDCGAITRFRRGGRGLFVTGSVTCRSHRPDASRLRMYRWRTFTAGVDGPPRVRSSRCSC